MTSTREAAFSAPADTEPIPFIARAQLARLPGLDGLRAVAVAAVVIFHLDVSLAPGGFMGVDIFFVISGFLITRMLTYELVQTGRIRLVDFYVRRARRLFPAAAVLITVVVLACCLVWRDQLVTLPASALSSLAYSTNWWLIADHQSYFASVGRPPMLQHLWSLAIEEQFYLVWPPLLLLALRLSVRLRPNARPILPIVALALGLALSSTLVMTLIARAQDVPYGASTSRVYFGTDTHSMGLFLGAAAGAWTVWWQQRRPAAPRPRRLAGLLGPELLAVVSFVGLAYAIATVDEYRPELYRGGFLLIDAVVVVVIMVIIRGDSALGRLLEWRPVRWVGVRSYSIYLWHWPVAIVTRPGIDVHGPTPLINVARIGVILLLADASYRFVERPLRARGLTQPAVAPRPAGLRVPFTNDGRVALAGFVGLLCLMVLLAAGSPLFSGYNSTSKHELVAAQVPSPVAPSAAAPTSSYSPAAAPPSSAIPSSSTPTPIASSSSAPAPAPPAVPSVAPTALAMSAFGDSVLLGAGRALAGDVSSLSLDAVEGRQANVVLSAVTAAQAKGTLAPLVAIDTGNNGVISPDQLDSTLAALHDRQRVVVVNDRVPRDWQDPNNQTLRTVTARYSNVVLVDWLHASQGHDGWFYEDGYHVNPTGAAALAALVVAAARS